MATTGRILRTHPEVAGRLFRSVPAGGAGTAEGALARASAPSWRGRCPGRRPRHRRRARPSLGADTPGLRGRESRTSSTTCCQGHRHHFDRGKYWEHHLHDKISLTPQNEPNTTVSTSQPVFQRKGAPGRCVDDDNSDDIHMHGTTLTSQTVRETTKTQPSTCTCMNEHSERGSAHV